MSTEIHIDATDLTRAAGVVGREVTIAGARTGASRA